MHHNCITSSDEVHWMQTVSAAIAHVMRHTSPLKPFNTLMLRDNR